MKYLPYTFPSQILEFMSNFVTSQLNDLKLGEKKELKSPSIIDYFATIPDKYKYGTHAMEYHNALLRMYQLLSNEGLITPLNNATGFSQQFQINGFNPTLSRYGYYDFVILGFQYIRDKFSDSVKPIIINQGVKDLDEDIGTGFQISFNRDTFFVTARHCLPYNSQIFIPAFLPQKKPLIPDKIWVPKNENIDIAIIKFQNNKSVCVSPEPLWVGEPFVLDEIMTMGYPPIQGFTDAILVTETAQVSSFLKSTTGEITGEGIHYWGGFEGHFLISARVKGGNSGGPVINKKGEVVGIIIELLKDGENLDLLGYGVAISSNTLKSMLNTICGASNSFEIEEIGFNINEKGFIPIK